MQQQNYDYFLVLDFEATCQEYSTISKQEIIEFPVLKVDATTFDVTDKFHEYIRPVHNPQLTDFCTKLTGIIQEMIDESDTFPDVFGRFQKWMMNNVGHEKRFLFVTCGDWDLKSMLPGQCQREKIIMPTYFNSWMNIKKTYAGVTGSFVKGMKPMLKELNIEHVGRLHSGVDDCQNIVRILANLAKMGCVFRPTSGERLRVSHSRRTAAAETIAADHEEQELKQNLYPFLSEESSSDDEEGATACSFLYQPDDGDDFHKLDKKTSKLEDDGKNSSQGNENIDHQSPDFQSIVLKLRENIASRRFKPRHREELASLCAAGKYLHLMEAEDRGVIEARLRLFYVTLCHGWRVAKKDAKPLTTASVGIHVAHKSLSRRERHLRKNLMG